MEGYQKPYLFDGTNYNNWCFRMEVILEEKQLLDCISQSADEMPEFVINSSDDATVKDQKQTRYDARKIKESRCKSLLIEKICDSQLQYIRGKTSPKAIWKTLENVFAKKGISSQFYLLKQLTSIKYKEDESMAKHLLKFEGIVSELQSSEIKMHELLIVFNLLETMPKSYQHIVTVLESLPPEQCTLEFVKCRLLSESVKRSNSAEVATEEESDAAFLGVKKKYKCYICHKLGHKASSCDKKKFKDKKFNKSGNDERKGEKKAFVAEADVMFVGHNNASNDSVDFKWILDSGASRHMVFDSSYLRNIKQLEKPVPIITASGEVDYSYFYGVADIITRVGNKEINATVTNVLLVPGMEYNLFSILSTGKLGMTTTFDGSCAKIVHKGRTVAEGKISGKVYILDAVVMRQSETNKALLTVPSVDEYKLWHRRLGHIGKSGMEKLLKKDMVDGIDMKKQSINQGKICEPCLKGKHSRNPFETLDLPRSSRPLELIHSDVCGPFNPLSWNGKKYYVSFTDDFTHFSVVYPISAKSEVCEMFQKYASMAEGHFDQKIFKLRCDNGGEYVNEEMQFVCDKKGIQIERTVPYTPQQNGVSERLNRTIMEKARAMIADSSLEKNLWNEAVNAAVYLINRSPTSALKEQTPYEKWYGHKPDLSTLRVWGSTAYSFVPKEKRNKLSDRSYSCFFIGYSRNGYRLWDKNKKTVFVSRDVVVDENQHDCGAKADIKLESLPEPIWLNSREETSSQTDEPVELDGIKSNESSSEAESEDDVVGGSISDGFATADETIVENALDEEATVLRRSNRVRKPPERYVNSNFCYALNAVSFVEDIPNSIEDLRKRSDWDSWKEAISSELESMRKAKTWTLVKPPPGCHPVDCKWVFTIKRDKNGVVAKYKARLVAKGFTQRYGYDYNETYSPVVKMSTIRMMFALANHHDLLIHQMDVKTAFLNGQLEEEIYMRQPHGFEEGKKVCRLNKSIYGLKQASRVWNDRFNQFVTRIGFRACENDSCLYFRNKTKNKVFLLLYVDDIIIMSTDLSEINVVKGLLNKEFEMVDLGEASMFLGMEIQRNKITKELTLNQEQYSKKILKRFEMDNCKPASIPMEPNLKLKKNDSDGKLNKPYRELIGCLSYLAITTRPDLSAAVNYFSQFQSNPTDEHWNYLKRILRYLKGTSDFGIHFRKTTNEVKQLSVYADANWATDVNDRRSVSGVLVKLYGSTVSWFSRKQGAVSLSSTEAECAALVDGACELIWMKKLLTEIGILENTVPTIFEDNQSTIAIMEASSSSKRLKHSDVKFHFIKDCLKQREFEIQYIPTTDQLADLLTKGLLSSSFRKLCGGIGISSRST